MKKKSLARAGIDEDSCLLRNKRVRYQTQLFENFREPSIALSPLLNAGYTRDGNFCVPSKYTKAALPDNLLSYTFQAIDISRKEKAEEFDEYAHDSDDEVDEVDDCDDFDTDFDA